jgi:hypothetical protein
MIVCACRNGQEIGFLCCCAWFEVMYLFCLCYSFFDIFDYCYCAPNNPSNRFMPRGDLYQFCKPFL